MAALLPRLAALGRYVTPDEPIWVFRSLRFREALLAGDWAATIQSGHPGVTVTWLGAVSVQLQLWLQPQSREHLIWLDKLYWLSPDNGPAFQHLSAFLTAARLGPILITGLGLVALYWLARTRLGRPAATIGTLLLALDPFTAGLSGLFHLDALLATFMLLAVLVVLPNQKRPQATITRREVILSGLFTAFAILTKTPGLFLLPFIPLLLLWRTGSLAGRLRHIVVQLLLWAGVVVVVIFLLFPAVWAAPAAVFETVGGLANRLSESAVRPIFFLGEWTLNPGPIFYPLVLAFRLSPVVCIGLLLSAVLLVARFAKPVMGKAALPTNSNLIWLLLFSVTFLFFLNLSAKRFDRYALPAILPLILISATGLALAAAKIQSTTISRAFIPILAIGQAVYLIAFWPFPLTAHNWLVGGPPVAQHVFPIGWGEGTGVAAKWLAENTPDSSNLTLFTSNIPAAAAFFPGQLLPLQSPALSHLQNEDYLLFIPQDWQTSAGSTEPTPASLAAAQQPPIQQFSFNNLERARIYTALEPADFMLSPFQSAPQQIHFSEQITIRSAAALPAAWPDPIQVGIEWQAAQPAVSDYFYRLELVDRSGEIWLSQEGPLLNAVDHPVRYWPAGKSQEVFYTFSPPSELAPGEYIVQVSLFDDQGARLGVFTEDGRFVGVTASLAAVFIPATSGQLPVDPPNPINAETELVGYETLPDMVGTGEPLKLDLWWRQNSETLKTGRLRLSIGDETAGGSETAETPLSTDGWRPGQVYHIRPAWRVPISLESGRYPLSLQWLDQNGRPQWPSPIILGEIEIIARGRSFDLPANLVPLEIQLGTVARLQQVEPEVSGDSIILTVTWQAVDPDGVFYTTFVHLLDESGITVAQADRPPLQPTHIWAPGQVVQEQYTLPRPPAGQYTIAIGLYDQTNGLRLPLYSAGGTRLPNDQYIVEVTVP